MNARNQIARRLCEARLRNGRGRCRAFALKDSLHCRLHAGRPQDSGSPEGRAATAAGHAAYYAKRRAAKARGEPVKRQGGRKRKHLIPRHWRFKLSEADETRVLVAMVLHDIRVRGGEPRPPWQGITSRSDEANALGSLERSLMIRLNDRDRPLAKDEMERLYALARHAEQSLALSGADVRLKRLEWEVDRFRLRTMTDAAIDRAAKPAPASHDVEQPAPHEVPPDNFRDALITPHTLENADQLRVEIDDRKRRLAQFNLAESTVRSLDSELARAGGKDAQLAVLDRWIDSMERAHAMTQTIVAGRDQAAYERAMMRPRPLPERLHSIAPWVPDR
jgi:hypothetical protein